MLNFSFLQCKKVHLPHCSRDPPSAKSCINYWSAVLENANCPGLPLSAGLDRFTILLTRIILLVHVCLYVYAIVILLDCNLFDSLLITLAPAGIFPVGSEVHQGRACKGGRRVGGSGGGGSPTDALEVFKKIVKNQ